MTRFRVKAIRPGIQLHPRGAVDLKLGYQLKCSWFQQLYFQHLYNFTACSMG